MMMQYYVPLAQTVGEREEKTIIWEGSKVYIYEKPSVSYSQN